MGDLSPLAGLHGLTQLAADANRISDTAPLGGLVSPCRVTLAGNLIADPRPLARLPDLGVLDVARNRIDDAGLLVGATSLHELWLGLNPLRDLRPLLALPALTGVDIEGIDPSTTPGIAELRAASVYVGGTA